MELITIASKPLGIKKVWFFEEKKVLIVKILSTHYKYVLVWPSYGLDNQNILIRALKSPVPV